MKINWKYTFGEIIIVIIGISIAFGLNNWASAQKGKSLAKQYLENLKLDIEADAEALLLNIDKIMTSMENNRFITSSLNMEQIGRDSIARVYFQELSKVFDFYPNQSTFEALKYSGDLNLIQNFKLRNDIVRHYDAFALLERSKTRFENVNSNYAAKNYDGRN